MSGCFPGIIPLQYNQHEMDGIVHYTHDSIYTLRNTKILSDCTESKNIMLISGKNPKTKQFSACYEYIGFYSVIKKSNKYQVVS